MTSRLQQLTDQGVAVWVDSIARDWIQKGELRRLRDQFCVVGVTSNPTIFQKAMGEGSFYDDDIARLAGQGLDARRIFEALALDDIRGAAADMEPVWERTGGLDGRISFEVPPDIADDTEPPPARPGACSTSWPGPTCSSRSRPPPPGCRPSGPRWPPASTSTSP
jgi:transaldolase